MFKKLVLLITILFITVGCTKESNKIYLDNEYYGSGEFIEISAEEYNNLESNNYVLFTYNSYCNLAVPCDKVFLEAIKKNHINILSMTFEEFKNTKLYNDVKYAPSVIIVSDGKIIDYLDANDDEDLEKYQSSDAFSEWLGDYISYYKR